MITNGKASSRKIRAVGKSIVARRESLGMSKAGLAKKAGIGWMMLHRIESGLTAEPGVFAFVRIARALGLTVEELLGRAVGV